ncbi:MAG TPA: serine/threonine-protein kinase [Kofleriaceae bacterium]|nr:serine/threonine-protein kinase [Kofleriaceae bacterium]
MAVDKTHNERTVVERRDALIGEVFDRRFRIEARIAAGGFGAIYRATHVKSGQPLALKVLHANLTHDAGVAARFRREGAALTRLRDPHTITAYELGEAPDGLLYIVMELLRGESLYERFRARGPLPWSKMIAIARAVCSSLIEAHALGIIHRDLKPTNIHLEPDGPDEDFVKVLDFGIAKIMHDSDIDSSELTHAGQMIGTLDYMSPEQMVGGMCDATSDIYTLGIVMYEMIAGRKPFDDANSAAAALAAVLTTTPPRLAIQAVVPAEVDRVVMRCIERQYGDRYQSALELAAALDEILAGSEEAVTTVDLTHPRGGVTTLKGMRAPARSPSLTPPPVIVDPALRAVVPTLPAAVVPAEAPAVAPAVASAIGDGADESVTSPAAAAAPASPPPARTPTPIDRDAPAPAPLSPSVPRPPPLVPEVTLVGPMPAPRLPARPAPPRARPSRPRQRPTGTPQVGSRISTNLRESYPTIHRSPPSPLRPQPSAFDDRPPSTIGGPVFDMSANVRRDTFVRYLALGVGIAIAIFVAFLIATW